MICTFDLEECIKTLGLEERGRVQRFVTNEVMRLSEPYVPFDIAGLYKNPGYLKDRVRIENKVDVVWDAIYARRLYYNPQYEYQGAPIRGGYWADRMLQNGGLKAIEEGARKVAKS